MDWGTGVADDEARPQRRRDGVLHLPHVVDHELRRLSPADRGELEDGTPPLRRRRDAQLRHLQSAGGARRHVPARPARARRKGNRSRRCARPRRWCCRRPTPIASGSTSSSRRSRPSASARRRSRRTIRIPSARPRPRPAPTAICPKDNDNNAIMAQLLLQGTNFINFVGYNA